MLLTFIFLSDNVYHQIGCDNRQKSWVEVYLSISIKFHPQCHLLHLKVFLVIDELPNVVCPLLDQDVEAEGGGHANADADQHNVPDMKDYDVPDMEDYDVHDMKKWKIKQDVPDMEYCDSRWQW